MNRPVEHYFTVADDIGDVTGLLIRPPQAEALYVFGHGAGAGMRHSFMESVASRLVCGRGQRDDHLEWIAARLRRELPATADN